MKKSYIFGGTAIVGLLAGGTFLTIKYLIPYLKEKKKFKEEEEEIMNDLDREIGSGTEPTPLKEVKFEDTVIKEKLLKNWDKPYIGEGADLETEMAEAEHPEDSDEDEKPSIFEDEEEMKNLEEDYESHKFYEDNKHKPPKIISADKLDSIPSGFETVEWIYWAKDEVMTDEDEQLIEDFERFTGDTLDKYGWRDNDSDHIYVLSYEFMCVYSITKFFLSYSEKMAESVEYLKDLEEKYGADDYDG